MSTVQLTLTPVSRCKHSVLIMTGVVEKYLLNNELSTVNNTLTPVSRCRHGVLIVIGVGKKYLIMK